ncbi:MAG: hypothetical protein H0W55_10955 [Actinobacteria bacterium]|nr:hypothetical protein [Actinomycetota bacterium]
MDRRMFLASGAMSLLSLKAVSGTAFAGTTLPLMPARMAESLCESYMVNTKIFYASSVYGHTDAVVDLLKDLGVRTVRERISTGTSSGTRNQQSAMLRLAAAGTKWHGTVSTIEQWRNAGAANKQVLDRLTEYYTPRLGGDLSLLMRSLGGVNEIDNPHNGPDWAKHARLMQTALWDQATARSATRDIPVAGPTTRSDYTRERAAKLGDLSAITDVGAFHYYNGGTSPTRGISERIAISRPNFPDTQRWIVCETGYNDSPQDNKNVTVPESASATYVVRGICDFFKRNAVYGRFELLDDPDAIDRTSQATINRTADIQAHFGLVAMTKTTVSTATPSTWRKKPEYYATKRFLDLLSDRGRAFSPSGLRMKVTGGGNDVQQLLVQKRDGRHYVMLWRDVVVAKPYPSGSTIKVDPVNVTLQFSPARPTAVYAPGRGPTPIAKKSSSDRVTVALGGDLLVVEIG